MRSLPWVAACSTPCRVHRDQGVGSKLSSKACMLAAIEGGRVGPPKKASTLAATDVSGDMTRDALLATLDALLATLDALLAIALEALSARSAIADRLFMGPHDGDRCPKPSRSSLGSSRSFRRYCLSISVA
jgi:hypothetical protein